MPKVQKGNQEMKLHFTHTHTIDLPLPLLPLTDAPPYNKWRGSKSRSKWVPGGQLLRGVHTHTHTHSIYPKLESVESPWGGIQVQDYKCVNRTTKETKVVAGRRERTYHMRSHLSVRTTR